jgi:hypothetical protein
MIFPAGNTTMSRLEHRHGGDCRQRSGDYPAGANRRLAVQGEAIRRKRAGDRRLHNRSDYGKLEEIDQGLGITYTYNTTLIDSGDSPHDKMTKG